MKQVLLLVAIYSLIIHQYHKNARQTATPRQQGTMVQKKNPGYPSGTRLYRLASFRFYDNTAGFDLLGSHNRMVMIKW